MCTLCVPEPSYQSVGPSNKHNKLLSDMNGAMALHAPNTKINCCHCTKIMLLWTNKVMYIPGGVLINVISVCNSVTRRQMKTVFIESGFFLWVGVVTWPLVLT